MSHASPIPLRRWLLAAALVLTLALPATGRADGNDPSLDELVKAFNVIAFGSEMLNVKATGMLLKWDTTEIPVNMTRFDSAQDHDLKPLPAETGWATYAWRHLRELEAITGLKFTDSLKRKKRPHITIVFTNRMLLGKVPIPGVSHALQAEMSAPGGCYFVAFPAKSGALDRAVVVVNTDRPAQDIDSCILEELTQSLGLPNDTDLIRPSIFSDHDHLVRLSTGDSILLKTLYNKRMKPGMSKKAAMTMARLLFAQELAARR